MFAELVMNFVNKQQMNLVNTQQFAAKNEPPHDKTNNLAVRPAKTKISLGIRPV